MAIDTTPLLSTEAAEALAEKTQKFKHPHGARRSEILLRHPEVATLFTTNTRSALYTILLVTLQLTTSIYITTNYHWLISLLTSYLFASIIDHALWVLIHDATHNLVYKSVTANRFLLIFANIPHVFPSAILFRYYHILHHIELNRLHKDPDVPYEWEAKLIGNSPIRKSLWLAFFFIVQAIRTATYTYRIPKGIELSWITINWISSLGTCALIHKYYGWAPILYLLFASISSVGLHPLGARWIQEHYPTQPFQSTYSYYGIANLFAFNIGYHNEHHDFPSVPWNLLPKLKLLAPEYYDTLFAYNSYSELLKDFILEESWSLENRFQAEKEKEARSKVDLLQEAKKVQ